MNMPNIGGQSPAKLATRNIIARPAGHLDIHSFPNHESLGKGRRTARDLGGTVAILTARGGAYLASASMQAGGSPARNASFRWSSCCSVVSCAAASAIGDWVGFCSAALFEM